MHYRDYYDISRFRPKHIEILDKINDLGPSFAARAAKHDRNASFPTENYQNDYIGVNIYIYSNWKNYK